MNRREFLLMLGFCACTTRTSPPVSRESETARELLRHTNNAYENVQSYQDRGVVLSHWRDKATPDETIFRTWFARPRLFRFDWRTHHPYPPLRHIISNHFICFDGLETQWWEDNPARLETMEDIGMAVAGATGVSSGSAYHIPTMLMKDLAGFRFDDLQNLDITREEVFENIECYVLTGEHPRGGRHELWIGKGDMLIRKIVTFRDGGEYDEEIRRGIVVNGPISNEIFCKRGSLLSAG